MNMISCVHDIKFVTLTRSQKLYMSCERVHKLYTLHLHDLLPPSSVKISISLCEVYEDKISTNSETVEFKIVIHSD